MHVLRFMRKGKGNPAALADWVGKVGFNAALPHVAKHVTGGDVERAKRVVGKLKGKAKKRGTLAPEHAYGASAKGGPAAAGKGPLFMKDGPEGADGVPAGANPSDRPGSRAKLHGSGMGAHPVEGSHFEPDADNLGGPSDGDRDDRFVKQSLFDRQRAFAKGGTFHPPTGKDPNHMPHHQSLVSQGWQQVRIEHKNPGTPYGQVAHYAHPKKPGQSIRMTYDAGQEFPDRVEHTANGKTSQIKMVTPPKPPSPPKPAFAKARRRGEGSRGGHVVGHTQSGKPIYADPNHLFHQGFTAADHADAYELWLKPFNDATVHNLYMPKNERVDTALAYAKERMEHHGHAMIARHKEEVHADATAAPMPAKVGHTRSGKPIYSGGVDHPEHAHFTADDHEDAAQAHDGQIDALQRQIEAKGAPWADAVKPRWGQHAAAARAHQARADSMRAQVDPGQRSLFGKALLWFRKTTRIDWSKVPKRTCEKCGKQEHAMNMVTRGNSKLCPACRGEEPLVGPEGPSPSAPLPEGVLGGAKPRRGREGLPYDPSKMTAAEHGAAASKLFERTQAANKAKKEGEGSRGGHVIGRTKSGKAVYDRFNHASHADFTKEDHLTAADLHEMQEKHSRDGGALVRADHHKRQIASHMAAAGYDEDAAKAYRAPARTHQSEGEQRAKGRAPAKRKPRYEPEPEPPSSQLALFRGGRMSIFETQRMFAKAGRKGPGSRGGKVIGYTKSGKAVYEGREADHPSHKDWSKDDHLEAAAKHETHAAEHRSTLADNYEEAERKEGRSGWGKLEAVKPTSRHYTPETQRSIHQPHRRAEREADIATGHKKLAYRDSTRKKNASLIRRDYESGMRDEGLTRAQVEDRQREHSKGQARMYRETEGAKFANVAKSSLYNRQRAFLKATGEGSRGGRVVGHRKTGKAIYMPRDEHARVLGGLKQQAADQMKQHPQYAGHEKPYRLARMTQDVTTKMGLAAAKGEHVLARHERKIIPGGGTDAEHSIWSNRSQIQTAVGPHHYEYVDPEPEGGADITEPKKPRSKKVQTFAERLQSTIDKHNKRREENSALLAQAHARVAARTGKPSSGPINLMDLLGKSGGIFERQRALMKAKGEGARGGHVIGHTKSGKAIYGPGHESWQKPIAAGRGVKKGDRPIWGPAQARRSGAFTDWSKDDHLEAARAHANERDRHNAAHNSLSDQALKEHGSHGSLISGVVRDHFPDKVKNKLRTHARAATAHSDASYNHYRLAGKRTHYAASEYAAGKGGGTGYTPHKMSAAEAPVTTGGEGFVKKARIQLVNGVVFVG